MTDTIFTALDDEYFNLKLRHLQYKAAQEGYRLTVTVTVTQVQQGNQQRAQYTAVLVYRKTLAYYIKKIKNLLQ